MVNDDDDDDCGADELSENEKIDDKPINIEEKENHCAETNNKPVTKTKKKANKKKKKGKTNDVSESKKDVSHHFFDRKLVTILVRKNTFIFNVSLNICIVKEEDEFLSWESEVLSNSAG